jgi:hypothetical protein
VVGGDEREEEGDGWRGEGGEGHWKLQCRAELAV